jgi:hypothetical protein
MDHQELRQRLATLTTAHLADACVRARTPVRCAPAPLRAETIRDTERGQAERMRAGVSLRRQVGFGTYLARRQQAPSLTFREHLRAVSGAIEE